MSQPKWFYSPLRDDVMWKYLVAGAAGAIPAAGLLPVAWRVASKFSEDEGLLVAALLLAPVLALSIWAAVWWVFAARRVFQLRHLAQHGVQVLARVQSIRLLRGRYGTVGAVIRLEYERDGCVHSKKKRTTARTFPWGTREGGSLDVVVDPSKPSVVALLLEGRLY